MERARRMIRIAFVSDVHGNLEALQRVREDIAAMGIERTVCLGDVASYNADQHACMKSITADGWDWVAGNHDLIAAGVLAPIHCGAAARYAAGKARRELKPEWREHIRRLPLLLVEDRFVGFHASPKRVNEYIRAEEVARETVVLMRAAGFPPVAFFGHTHRACVWTWLAGELERRVGDRLDLDPDGVHLVNVGTVGEPRDGTRHATYVVFDAHAHSVEFRRLEYDHRAARRKAEAGGWRRARRNGFPRAYDEAVRLAGRLRHRLLPLPVDDTSIRALQRRQASDGIVPQLGYRWVQSDQPTLLPGLVGPGAGKLAP